MKKTLNTFGEKVKFPTAICRVDLLKLESNIKKLKNYVKKTVRKSPKILIPVKANAYGHGILPVTTFLQYRNICDYIGVAHLEEAYELRRNGITMPILIMGQSTTAKENLEYIIKNDIEQAISNEELLTALNNTAAKLSKTARIHLDVDTGMGRTGVLYSDIKSFVGKMKKMKNVKLTGVMTHFAVSDATDKNNIKFTESQIAKFKEVEKLIRLKFKDKSIIFHTSNSGGVVLHKDSVFDMIRPGIAVYGYFSPDLNIKLEPVMEIESELTLIKVFPAGHSIGYGRTYKVNRKERIGIVPLGYGDGLIRGLSNKLTPIINGKKAQSVGRISMDQFAVRVQNNAKVGDKVYIIGGNKNVKNTAADMAEQCGTISYEILCDIGNSKRVSHEYIY